MIKTVITAGGKGTRLLPVTNTISKEMMPVFNKLENNQKIVSPLLQLIFEQLYYLKIRDFCFIINEDKKDIQEHFTIRRSFLDELKKDRKESIYSWYKKLNHSNITWINQNKPLGFGDAVLKAKKFVKNEDFIVHAGDVAIIKSKIHPISRLITTANKNRDASAILLCKKITQPERYGVPTIKKISQAVFKVIEVEEKPLKPKSKLGILPMYFFRPSIFDCLRKIKQGKNNEYQLTDAIQMLLDRNEKVIAISLENNEKEVDVGTVESYKESLTLTYKYS